MKKQTMAHVTHCIYALISAHFAAFSTEGFAGQAVASNDGAAVEMFMGVAVEMSKGAAVELFGAVFGAVGAIVDN
jgi:hypothetical protein